MLLIVSASNAENEKFGDSPHWGHHRSAAAQDTGSGEVHANAGLYQDSKPEPQPQAPRPENSRNLD
ncbi:MAG: hypothetical protein IJU98_09145 [Synergistaceae bacterium]|nr:hypothetical protein [Synergistaceae bacterium]